MIEVKIDHINNHGRTKNAKQGAKKISVTEISSKPYSILSSPPKVHDFSKLEVDKAIGKTFTGNRTPM